MAHSEQMHRLSLALTPLLVTLLLTSLPQCEPQPDDRYSSCTPTPYSCGSVQFDVGYPLSVDGGADRPDYCSFPGYRLSCTSTNGSSKLLITMNPPAGGAWTFQVTGVDYENRLLTLVDQGLAQQTCLQPYRNTTIDGALFAYTDRDQFLTVYVNCSGGGGSLPLVVDVLSCLSGGTSYYSTDNGTVAPDLLGTCSSTLVVPYNSSMAAAAGSSGLGNAVRGGFAARWTAGAGWCRDCENSGGRCGYNSTSPTDHTCYCSDGTVIGACSSGSKNNKKAITIGTSIAAGVLSLLLVVMTCLYIRKRRQYNLTSSSRLLKPTASGGTPRSIGSTTDMESGSVHSLQTHHFTYEELEEATDSFSGTMEIGDGGFGTVYKGHLRDGREVAVKRLYNNSCRRVEQFLNEAAILSRLRHPNLVLFYGCTSSRSRELLLVYEFVPNGTLADHLHGDHAAERALTWPLRLGVAVEAAAALAYLHAVEPPVVHRDVKTSNILLDANFHVKVADFGLSRLFPLDVTHVSTAPQGTPGYVDPEYHQCYQLTDRSDVYSFGVVLVELISSKPAVDVTRDRSEINLAGMAIHKIQQCQLEQLVDLDLGYGSDEATRKAMTMVAELAFRCLQQNGEMRPPIKEVLDALRSIQEDGFGKKGDALIAPRSPDTVHAPWDSMSTTPSISQ
ncbi:LEAF RUST 10 DISEASE-RESISTANCE LOCUS RECEPTOR-LIKE PROTEIN KINASE-like 1.2 isoform X2 [Sorghum bicolor]|uniref:LEAF RUST 10 DISEASE-RESISTANCE LOCUS RECEPTOR-LIKE PROTEIN KINASE-like 1.2 isoform X2 n=1 Tax=Sorghum bicolor TaxID=4558 RepID=UPI000B425590|nr:LEAF RUST 10 DISEASE-RESISTANCE LOCUS RECEPTOR-LIKE PROTEIN KINASE-like 1.2 isoform X2 [Sorghum bicolor]|eukprot:XP_021302680.1 LEAF RUST 10 DISEASE-RESISTANCE LOCUS RECEPTOR-LIKE PROTEIN KINASE-like 1.2 isoform X2 [Sorghum bicolor]